MVPNILKSYSIGHVCHFKEYMNTISNLKQIGFCTRIS